MLNGAENAASAVMRGRFRAQLGASAEGGRSMVKGQGALLTGGHSKAQLLRDPKANKASLPRRSPSPHTNQLSLVIPLKRAAYKLHPPSTTPSLAYASPHSLPPLLLLTYSLAWRLVLLRCPRAPSWLPRVALLLSCNAAPGRSSRHLGLGVRCGSTERPLAGVCYCSPFNTHAHPRLMLY